MLLKELKRDLLQSRKARTVETTKTLVTVLGELETVSKRNGDEITDKVIVSKIKKTISTNLEIIELNVHNADELIFENQFLSQYLPQQLCEAKITEILSEVLFNNIGEGMKYLSANYAGQYDGKLAKKVILNLIK